MTIIMDTRVYMYVWMYVRMHVCIHLSVCVCVCMCVCMYVCVYVCVYIYINNANPLQVCWQLASRIRRERSDPARKLYDIYPLLCVQRKTPDDGQRSCPKHVEFYSKNKFEKSVHLVGFVIRIYHDARSPERLLSSRVTRATMDRHLQFKCTVPLGDDKHCAANNSLTNNLHSSESGVKVNARASNFVLKGVIS